MVNSGNSKNNLENLWLRDNTDILSVKSCNERWELAVSLTSYHAGYLKFLKRSMQLIIYCCELWICENTF